jgi:hypothetical protein
LLALVCLDDWHTRDGAAIDVSTGEVLAMAVWPSVLTCQALTQ